MAKVIDYMDVVIMLQSKRRQINLTDAETNRLNKLGEWWMVAQGSLF